ncbi:MAG: DUF3846 domain-containing protein [Caulobacteraceae bacterium]|nr:DUF3846 domain-containing protein [Caulobacteraceae bacterium]
MKKEKVIRAILIDPFARKVSEIKLVNELEEIYKTLGCDLITITGLRFGGKQLDLILDDEGLLKDRENQRYFKYKLFSQPFAGKGLLVGSDKEGNCASIPDDVYSEQVDRDIIWFNPSDDELDATLEWKVLPI